MKRRSFVLAALGSTLPVAAWGQDKTARIGLLWLGAPDMAPLRKAFFDGLRQHGYVEGRNLIVEDQTDADRYEKLLSGAQELVRRKVNLIVAFGNTSVRAARRTTDSIPIVMMAGFDPVKDGVAVSLARPGGNLTGVSTLSNELHGKWAQLIRETLPGAGRIGALSTPTSDFGAEYLRALQAEGRRVRLEFQPLEVGGAEDLDRVFAAAAKAKMEALVILPSTLLRTLRLAIAQLAVRHRMPVFGYSPEFSEAGALLSYGVSRERIFRRAADYVDRILKGTPPGELPIEWPSEFDLVVNLGTAKALGITLPPTIMLRATRTIA